MSFRKGNYDLLFRNGNDEIVERRRIPNNIRDIVDHKFHFLSLAQVSFCTLFQERKLTLLFIAKASLINRLTANYEIAFAHNYRIKIIGLDFFCFDVVREENIDIDRRARPS